MPTVSYDGSKKRDELVAILPDPWPLLKDGLMTMPPWCAAIWDAKDSLEAEANARDLKRAIERGNKFWRSFSIEWTPEQLASVLDKPISLE